MCINARVACCACQVLVLFVWDMQVRSRVAVFLGEAKINDIHLIAALANAQQKVVGLDVTKKKRKRVSVVLLRLN